MEQELPRTPEFLVCLIQQWDIGIAWKQAMHRALAYLALAQGKFYNFINIYCILCLS